MPHKRFPDEMDFLCGIFSISFPLTLIFYVFQLLTVSGNEYVVRCLFGCQIINKPALLFLLFVYSVLLMVNCKRKFSISQG